MSVLWTYFEKELRKSLSKIEIGDLKPESSKHAVLFRAQPFIAKIKTAFRVFIMALLSV